MAQSLFKIYVHLIFHIKSTSSPIREEDLEHIFAYVGQIVNSTGCTQIRVGGTGDHLHLLFMLAKDVTVSGVVEAIKSNSSRWIKTLAPYYRAFSWQRGYAALSVSQSVVDKTLEYISNQREHHKKHTFTEEYIAFLKSYGIEYNEAFLFSD